MANPEWIIKAKQEEKDESGSSVSIATFDYFDGK